MNNKSPINEYVGELASLSTAMPEKMNFFKVDPYFKDVAIALQSMFGRHTICEVQKLSFVLLKPDGVAARKVNKLFDVLLFHGFDILRVEEIHLNRLSIRELWRYELNKATPIRMHLIDILLTSNPSVFFLIRGDSKHTASILRNLKGPVRKSERLDDHIREQINAEDGLLNFIHTPDEMADLIREIGILFSPPKIKNILSKSTPMLQMPPSFVDRIYENSSFCGFKLKHSLQNFRKILSQLDEDIAVRIEADLRRIENGEHFDWSYIWDIATQKEINIEIWDLISIFSAATDFNLPAVEPVLKTPG